MTTKAQPPPGSYTLGQDHYSKRERLERAAPELLDASMWARGCLAQYLGADSTEGRDYCRKDLEHADARLATAIAKATVGE